MTLLEVKNLRAGYGPADVLHGIDLSVGAGTIHVMLGANGAGKTTMLRAISGTVAGRGHIVLDGTEISAHRPARRVGIGLAHVPQGRGTFVDLTVEENLRVGAYLRSDRDGIERDLTHWLSFFPRLGERRRQLAGAMSGGEQQMLAIARAMMLRPKLLLLDEPSLGLAPIVTKALFAGLQRLNQELGLTLLLVEQNANLSLEIAAQASVIEAGRIVQEGPAAELASDDRLRRAYLGN